MFVPHPLDISTSSQHNNNNAIAAQKKFRNEAVLVDGPPLLALRIARHLGPHLLDVLQNHVKVAVEGADAREHLAVVAQRDEDLGVVAHCGLKHAEGPDGEFVRFEEGEFVLTVGWGPGEWLVELGGLDLILWERGGFVRT